MMMDTLVYEGLTNSIETYLNMLGYGESAYQVEIIDVSDDVTAVSVTLSPIIDYIHCTITVVDHAT